MSFPLGGDFSRAVNRGLNIVSSDPVLDQGKGFFVSSSPPSAGYFSANLASGATKTYTMAQLLATLSRGQSFYKFETTASGAAVIAQVSASNSGASFFEAVPSSISSFWKMAQFNPGVYARNPGWFSDLFILDVFSSVTTISKLTWHFIETLGVRLDARTAVDGSGNLVQTDYYTTISGNVDICEGDLTPPNIVYIQPTASGINLRPRNQVVEFQLNDAVAGVDLSTLTVDVNSTTSGTISLVVAGADQTGGDVSIVGDPTGYTVRYTPSFLWDYNDTVTVTISGSDLIPTVGGNPFLCAGLSTNAFAGDIPFQILNEEDISASITAVGDTAPPFISLSIPASGTSDNSIFTPVTIKIADDFTGVNLSTLDVVIDGVSIVNNGSAVTSETVISGNSSEYTVLHTPTTAFVYGSTVVVDVTVDDLVISPGPNSFVDQYSFSFIESGTLIIENFEPTVGTHHNLDSVDIQVDLRDDTYGVDEDQSFFVINGTMISGTRTPLTSGTRMTYHPPNDFNYGEPIRITVHGTNGNSSAPVVKELFFTLFYGCRILYFNEDPYVHADNVDVFVRARNAETFHKDLSSGYFFTAYTQPSEDMGASIEAINPQADLGATIDGDAPEHRYGETVTVVFSVEDFEGRLLGPYTFTYTIENSPV